MSLQKSRLFRKEAHAECAEKDSRYCKRYNQQNRATGKDAGGTEREKEEERRIFHEINETERKPLLGRRT